MAETLIIILIEHNVPINFADHFTKLVSNKLVFPDSVFLRVRAACAPCSLKVVIPRVVTIFFSRNLTGLHASSPEFDPYIWHILSWSLDHEKISTATLPLPLIQEEQLSVTDKKMCTKYW